MVFNQINQNVQNAATRCSPRTTRPPSPFPPYFLSYFLPDFQTIQYQYVSNGTNYQGLMGNKMEVILLPGAYLQSGTAPGNNQLEPITQFLRSSYPQHNFIKGHMWNQEIGGKGITKNLVPLTQLANSAHNAHSEQPLKDALLNFSNFYAGNPPDHPDFKKVYGFKYVVEIEGNGNGGFQAWGGVQEPIVPNSIHVQLFPLICDTMGNYSLDNSIINTAINSTTLPFIQRLSGGIWIDQAGTVTDA